MQFQAAVSHSMGAHTEALCLTADSSSSDEASPATTSESPATSAAMLNYVCIKRKIRRTVTNKFRLRSFLVLYYGGR